jgi:hypothetical protein
MDSISTNVDLELLAALIDGRLSGEERARALKLLANSDEALELYAQTLQHTAGAQIVPITSARRWRQWKVMVPMAAAAALAIVMVPRLIGRGGQPGLANEYAMQLSQNPRFAGGLRDGWEARGWPVTRGAGTSRETPGTPRAGSPAETKLAFRLGVRSVDLQVALRRGDSAAAGRVAREILETLNAVAFSESVAASYNELASRLATDGAARSIERASSAERDMRELLVSPSFEFGQWVGAADLAAQTHDASFFESKHGTRYIRSTIAAGSVASDDADALRSIDARLSQGITDTALDDVHAVFQTMIRRRGS